jgi:hypothetical protein
MISEPYRFYFRKESRLKKGGLINVYYDWVKKKHLSSHVHFEIQNLLENNAKIEFEVFMAFKNLKFGMLVSHYLIYLSWK